jgi:hypothetical protein
LHLALPASGRLIRVLGAVVPPLTALMTALDPKLARGRAIRAQVVGDHSVGTKPHFLRGLRISFRGGFVSLGLHQHVEEFALPADGAPQIDHAASDFQIHLVEVPGPAGFGAAFAQSAAIIGLR